MSPRFSSTTIHWREFPVYTILKSPTDGRKVSSSKRYDVEYLLKVCRRVLSTSKSETLDCGSRAEVLHVAGCGQSSYVIPLYGLDLNGELVLRSSPVIKSRIHSPPFAFVVVVGQERAYRLWEHGQWQYERRPGHWEGFGGSIRQRHFREIDVGFSAAADSLSFALPPVDVECWNKCNPLWCRRVLHHKGSALILSLFHRE